MDVRFWLRMSQHFDRNYFFQENRHKNLSFSSLKSNFVWREFLSQDGLFHHLSLSLPLLPWRPGPLSFSRGFLSLSRFRSDLVRIWCSLKVTVFSLICLIWLDANHHHTVSENPLAGNRCLELQTPWQFGRRASRACTV